MLTKADRERLKELTPEKIVEWVTKHKSNQLPIRHTFDALLFLSRDNPFRLPLIEKELTTLG